MVRDIRILLFDLHALFGWSFWVVAICVSIYLESKFLIYVLVALFVCLVLNVVDGIWRSGQHNRFWSIDPKTPRKQRMKELRQIFIDGLDS